MVGAAYAEIVGVPLEEACATLRGAAADPRRRAHAVGAVTYRLAGIESDVCRVSRGQQRVGRRVAVREEGDVGGGDVALHLSFAAAVRSGAPGERAAQVSFHGLPGAWSVGPRARWRPG